MATRVESADYFSREAPQPFARLPWTLPSWLRLVLVLLVGALLAGVGYLGATHYPNTAPPVGSAAERQLVSSIGLPVSHSDSTVDGDLLVERFYVVDVETGDRYVADLVKGRVTDLQESQNDNGTASYSLLLDLRGLQGNSPVLGAYVSKVAPPDDSDGYYLGLRVPAGDTDAFRVNYDGSLPPKRTDFSASNGDDAYSFLVKQRYDDVSDSAQLINVEGSNFLLSNTAQFPFFRTLFGINKAVFLSQLILVDTTSHEHAITYYRLYSEYSHSMTTR